MIPYYEQTTDGNEQPSAGGLESAREYCTIQRLARHESRLQPDQESPDQNRQREADLQAQCQGQCEVQDGEYDSIARIVQEVKAEGIGEFLLI